MATYKAYKYETYINDIGIIVRVFKKYGRRALFKFKIFGTHIDESAKRKIESGIDNISHFLTS